MYKRQIDDKLLFKNIAKKAKEQDLYKKLLKIQATIGFELAALLSTLLFQQYEKGLRYLVLHKTLSEEWKKKVSDILVTDGHFNFSRGLGFKNWKGVPKSELTLFPYKMKFPFPTEALKYHTIESIDLHNTKLTSMPKGLKEFKDLKKIDLSFNMFKTISPQFKALEKLEFLDLSYNTFENFPVNIIKLPKLKQVDLRNNRVNYNYNSLIIPDEVKAAMPHCEILV